MQLLVEHIQGKNIPSPNEFQCVSGVKTSYNWTNEQNHLISLHIHSYFILIFVGWLDAIYSGSIAKLLQMVYNSIHLEVVVFQRVWLQYTLVPNAGVAITIGEQVVSGIRIDQYKLWNKLQHQFNFSRTNHAWSIVSFSDQL